MSASPAAAAAPAHSPPDPACEPWEHDLLAIVLALSQRSAAVVPFVWDGGRIYFVNSAAGARHVLIEHRSGYASVPLPLAAISRSLTEPGAALLRQRLAQSPRRPSPPLSELVPSAIDGMIEQLSAHAAAGRPVDLLPVFKSAMLGLMTRTLFGITPLTGEIDAAAAAKATMERYRAYSLPPGTLAHGTDARARHEEAFASEWSYSREILARAGLDDLLPDPSKPIPAFDDESPRVAAEPLAIVSRVLMNGYNGPAIALGWLAWVLAKFPATQAKVAAEADAAFCGTPPVFDDGTALPFSRMVVQETLRLYPPAWLLARVATADDTLGGVPIEKGASVALSPFTLHRDARHWPEPERFLPERFDPQTAAAPKAGSYLPFGLGPSMCPASAFALKELQYAIARLAHRFAFVAPPNENVRPWGLISLHPSPGVRLHLRERNRVT